MDGDVLRAALDVAARSSDGSVAVSFQGGEPLLELAKIREVIEDCEANRTGGHRPVYYLTTNGTLLDEGVAALLARHRVRTVISFDGVAGAQELRATGTFPTLDGVLTMLRVEYPEFFSRHVSVAVTLTSSNVVWLGRSIGYLLGKGVRTIEVNPLFTRDAGWDGDTRGELDRQFEEVDRLSRDHYERTGRVPVKVLRRYWRPHRVAPGTRPMCGALAGTKIAVDVDGTAWACGLLAESCQELPDGVMTDLADTFRLGHITDPEIPERLATLPERIERSSLPFEQRDRRSHRGECRDCRFVDECAVCPIALGHVSGASDGRYVSDQLCDFYWTASHVRAEFPELVDPLDLVRGLFRGRVRHVGGRVT